MRHLSLAKLCCLGSALWLALASLPYAAVGEVGFADVLSAIYVDEREPGCNKLHLGEDYIYITPNVTGTPTGAWRQVTSGVGLTEKYKVLTGDVIDVRYKDTSSSTSGGGGARRLMSDPPSELQDISVISESEGHEIYTGTQIRVKSIIYLISTCGWNTSATVDEMRSLYFDANFSISGYHDTCSYGKVSYDSADNVVFGPVEVPCKGTVSNGILSYPYDASAACGAAEQFAWRQYGEAAARRAGLGPFFDNTTRRRIVHILPREVRCPWAGLGSVGCGGSSCTVYIKGAYARSLTVNMHELSHTQGLSHAGQGFDEYGDLTDVMGTAKSEGYLCMNVGNQFRVGWNTPVGVVLPGNTSAVGNTGRPGRWVLPATSLTDTNALYLRYFTPEARFPNFFVSFRIRGAKYDNVLPTTNSKRVYIHVFNGTASDRDYNRTLLVATLSGGGSYTSPFLDRNLDPNSGGGFRLTVISVSNSSATVQLCRLTQLVESGPLACSDGLDNDCDGLTDSADPSCALPPPPP